MHKISFCDDLGAPLLAAIMNNAWWENNKDELLEWFRYNNVTFSSMLVLFPDTETKSAFMLRWT